MKKGIQRSVLSIFTGVFILTTPQAKGDVDISWTFGGGFSPSTVVVGLDEPVNWWNDDNFFDLSLTLEGYSPILLESGFGVWTTFDTPGVYDFESDSGDNGSVIVNIAPEVTITNPLTGAVFSAPATFIMEASTSETPDDGVAYLEFLVGTSESTNSLGFDYDVPFSASVTNLTAGAYTLIAVATDTRGWSETNAIAVTVSSPTSINLSAPRVSGSQFLFDVAGLTVGKTNVVQTSVNGETWLAIKTNVATAASAVITNAVSPGPRFYRVFQRP